MEITSRQVEELKKELGESKFNEIVNNNIDYEDKTVLFKGNFSFYKLHRIKNNKYTFVDLGSVSSCADGDFSEDEIPSRIRANKCVIFNSMREAINSGFFKDRWQVASLK